MLPSHLCSLPPSIPACVPLPTPDAVLAYPLIPNLSPSPPTLRSGLSKRYPLCDGSHKGSTFSPVKMTNETAEPVVKYLCSCGHSKKTDGTCDGSHRKINLTQ